MLIQAYQERWVTDFEMIRSIIETQMEALEVRFEHIGSTSVPFLAAKPIIDIDLVYENIHDFDKIVVTLARLGYFHHGDFGISGREVFKLKQKEGSNQTLIDIQHHLYVCHNTNKELQRHIAFREYLKANKTARLAYQELKLENADLTNQDHKKYAALKEVTARQFIESILLKSKQNTSNKII